MMQATATHRSQLSVAEVCDRGLVRSDNQDSVLQSQTPLGQLLLVADGIGGYEGGAVASRMVAEAFRAVLAAAPAMVRPDVAIREASARANANVHAAANAPGSTARHMGSTVVLAVVQQVNADVTGWIGHIGDSRAYLMRDGRLSRITTDHSAVQALLSRNLITPEEAVNHPDASVLTRSIGQEEEVEIDIDVVTLAAGDTLLLCSDGLWGYVDERAIEAAMADPTAPLEKVANSLLQLALGAGGRDNVGIELGRLEQPPPAPVKQGRMRGRRLLETLAIALLIFGGLGALIFLAREHHWFMHGQ